MSLSAVTIVFIIAALQSLIASVTFFFMKQERGPLHPRILGVLFLLISLSFIDGGIERLGGYFNYPNFAFIANVLALGIPAILYFYARAVTVEHFRFRWHDLLHSSAVLVTGVISLFAYHFKTREEKLLFWRDGYEDSLLTSPALSSFIMLVVTIQIVLMIARLRRNHEALKQVRSNTLEESFSVLKGFGLAYAGIIILNIIHSYLFHTHGPESNSVYIVELMLGVWSYILISSLLVGMIWYPERSMALSDEEVEITGFETGDKPTQVNESEYWGVLDDSLEQYMREQQPHLDANLTLVQLARKLGVPGRELSGFINNQLNQNFSDYIADWRIDEVKAILSANDFGGSITDAMNNAGFNSKSTFNVHFKKRTGKTPSQWRENLDNPPQR